MKKIFIPVAIVVLILLIVATVLSKTSPTSTDYHVHEDGQTHFYEAEVSEEYHTHADGSVHYGEH